MTTRPIEDQERRITQLRGDVDFLIEHIDGVESRLTRQIKKLRKRIDGHDARFDAHDKRFDAIDTQLGALQETLVEVLRRLPDAS